MDQIVSDTAIFAISPSKILLTTSVCSCVVRVGGAVWALAIHQKNVCSNVHNTFVEASSTPVNFEGPQLGAVVGSISVVV